MNSETKQDNQKVDANASNSKATVKTVADTKFIKKGKKNKNHFAVLKKFDIPQVHNQPGKTYFADPDPEAKPLYDGGVTVMKENQIIGDFLIRKDFPYNVVSPYLDSLKTNMHMEGDRMIIIREAVNQLLLCTFITAISNVLNSVNPSIYARYKALKGTFRTEFIQLPNFLNGYLSMLGDVESKLGKLEMRYSGVYLASWATLAHQYYAQAREQRNPELDDLGQEINFPVWNNDEGQEFIIQKFCAYYNKHRGEFGVPDGDGWMMVQTPEINLQNFDRYDLNERYVLNDVDRGEIGRVLQQIRHWMAGNDVRDVQISGQVYDLRHNLDLRQLANQLEADIENMRRKPLYFTQFFNTTERIVSKNGAITQLISGEGQRVRAPIPFSDGEAFAGYITQPCEDFNFTDWNVARFDQKRDNVVALTIEKDLKLTSGHTIIGRY